MGCVGTVSTGELEGVSEAGNKAAPVPEGLATDETICCLRLRYAGGLCNQCERNGVGLDQKAAGWLVSQQEINLRRVRAYATANQEKADLASSRGGNQQVTLGMFVGQGLNEHQLWLMFGMLHLKQRRVSHYD